MSGNWALENEILGFNVSLSPGLSLPEMLSTPKRQLFLMTFYGSPYRLEFEGEPRVRNEPDGTVQVTVHDVEIIELIPEDWHAGAD